MANKIEAVLVTLAQTMQPGEQPNALPLTPIETSQAAKVQFFQSSIFCMLLVVLLGGALTYFISGRVLQPLQKLCEQMENRTVQNLSEALPVPQSCDEIANLTKAFNQMSEKLQQAFAMQQRFSQSAAYELRTPLAVLKTKVDVFRKKQVHTLEEYDKLLSVMTAQTNRLSNLVKDLLELTNMDELDCNEPILLKDMLTEVTEELCALADEKHVSLVVAGDAQMIAGNRSLLHRAFYNLVENAVKYNVDGGQVTILIGAQSEAHTVSIADTGIGIPPKLQNIIFKPFYRVDKSRSRQVGGAGLGLAIVRAIVEKHGGSVVVEEKDGQGTVFRVTLL